MRLQLRERFRGWGKYAAELAVVVVGVVLGLGATEWVGSRKADEEVRDTHRALNRELSFNLRAVQFRHLVGPCVRVRAEELSAWMARQRAGERDPLPAEIGRPGAATLFASVWDVAKTGQAASKMPLESRLGYASMYDSIETFSELQMSERDVWFAIGDFAGLSSVSDAELARLNGLVARANAFNEALGGNYPGLVRRFAQLNVRNDSALPRGLAARRAICQPFRNGGGDPQGA